MNYIGAMVLAIVASVAYHLIARSIPTGVHPLLTLTVTYLIAAIVTVALLPVFPLEAGLGESMRKVNWTGFALGIALVGIELGFLLSYRAGWDISLAPLVAIASTTVILIPVGVLAFKEHLNLSQVIGLALTVVGLVLINRK